MEKDRFVKALREASKLEETHSAVIAGFFLSDFDWEGAGFPQEKILAVKALLRTIQQETTHHEEMLEEMMKYARESGSIGF